MVTTVQSSLQELSKEDHGIRREIPGEPCMQVKEDCIVEKGACENCTVVK